MTCVVCGSEMPNATKRRRYCRPLCKHRAHDATRQSARTARNRESWAQALTGEPADLGWLAGIVDGEGTIALTTTSAGNPTLRFHIYNTSLPIVTKLREVLARIGVPFNEQYDTRDDRKPCATFTLGTEVSLRLHPLLRPHLVRQVDRYDDAVTLLGPKYMAGRKRVRWTDEERGAWERLRERHNAR